MPKYCYKCKECDHQFDVRHAMGDRLFNCDECGFFESLVRIPQMTTKPIEQTRSRVGDKVKEFIRSNKESLKEQIKNSKEEYKP
tara:strand:- start:284 stop:535 length:252 start_codon:yes stop_codon:yes gene_type:complete